MEKRKTNPIYQEKETFSLTGVINMKSLMALKKISRLQKAVSNMAVMDITDIKPLLPLFINCLRITEYLYLRHSTPVL